MSIDEAWNIQCVIGPLSALWITVDDLEFDYLFKICVAAVHRIEICSVSISKPNPSLPSFIKTQLIEKKTTFNFSHSKTELNVHADVQCHCSIYPSITEQAQHPRSYSYKPLKPFVHRSDK